MGWIGWLATPLLDSPPKKIYTLKTNRNMWVPKNIEMHAIALHTKRRTIDRSVVCEKFVMLNDGIFTFRPLHVSYFFYFVAFQEFAAILSPIHPF